MALVTKRRLDRTLSPVDQLVELAASFDLTPAEQGALLRAAERKIDKGPRALLTGVIEPLPDDGRTPEARRKARSRAYRKAGYCALQGQAYVSEDSIAALHAAGIIPVEATERDADLLDCLTLRLPELILFD